MMTDFSFLGVLSLLAMKMGLMGWKPYLSSTVVMFQPVTVIKKRRLMRLLMSSYH